MQSVLAMGWFLLVGCKFILKQEPVVQTDQAATPEFQINFIDLIEDKYYTTCGSPDYHDLYKVYCIAKHTE